jgi:hypothetical protein
MPAFGFAGIDFANGFDTQANQMDGKPFHYWTTILKECTKDFLISKAMRKHFFFDSSVLIVVNTVQPEDMIY